MDVLDPGLILQLDEPVPLLAEEVYLGRVVHLQGVVGVLVQDVVPVDLDLFELIRAGYVVALDVFLC